MEVISALELLRERFREQLQLESSEQPAAAAAESRNHVELFSNNNEIIWIVDDTPVSRQLQTFEGRFLSAGNWTTTTTDPIINGAVLILNPMTGQLSVYVVHPIAQRQAAVEAVVGAVIRSLPDQEHPNQIIVTRKGMLDLLTFYLQVFPNTVVIQRRGLRMQLPLAQACLKMKKVGAVIQNATVPKFFVFNIYDDWLMTISSSAALSRLSVILRALQVDHVKTKKMLLEFDETVVTEPHHHWPSLSDDQWEEVEVALRVMIFSDDD